MPPSPDPAYHPLVRHTVHGLRTRCGVQEGASIVVAVSGGADSVALLRALRLLAPRRRWRLRLHAAHVQHHLRDDAEADAGFVEALAHQLRLPHHRRDITVPTGNTEAQARKLRYQALADVAQEAGARFIATAHHADDHLETILMRLLRGTTADGLRGIAWKRGVWRLASGVGGDSRSAPPTARRQTPDATLIRPMLAATHAEALDFLEQLGQPWREDHTNTDRTRTRARLRHEVLPVLRELRPSVARKALELSDRLRHNEGPQGLDL